MDRVHFLKFPGIPWNLDVALMALVYVGIGFFYKDKIKELLECDSRRFDLLSGLIAVALSLFCWFIYKNENQLYYFDMKPVYYKEFISALLIATVYKGNIIKNLIMDCQSYTKYRPNETTGGIFVSWRRKEELPTGA